MQENDGRECCCDSGDGGRRDATAVSLAAFRRARGTTSSGATSTTPRHHAALTFSYFLELLILVHIFADSTGGTHALPRTVFTTAARLQPDSTLQTRIVANLTLCRAAKLTND